MKQAIVMGYQTRNKSEEGEVLFLGADKDAAKKTVNDPAGGYARKEMYVLAVPSKRRCFEVAPVGAAPRKPAKRKTKQNGG